MASESLQIDALGLVCPLPLILLQLTLEPLAAGTEVTLLADDPSTLDDIPYWCQQTGQDLVSIDTTDSPVVKIRVMKRLVDNP